MAGTVTVLGIFVADMTFRGERPPRMGETLLGEDFSLGPGGKGSNQAIAAARAGAATRFITRLGQDTFAQMALDLWAQAGVLPLVTQSADSYTGAASIFVDSASGDNAITVAPGAAGALCAADLDRHRDMIASSDVFMTQLEQPLSAAKHGLELARAGGAITILNPAPATEIADDILRLCDYVTPNETEAGSLTGLPVTSPKEAEAASRALRARGAGAVIVTLGENGVLFQDANQTLHLPTVAVAEVVETTGAGDAFNGAFAAALAEGQAPLAAIRFANAAASLSVMRPGAAASMPMRKDIEVILAS